MSKRTPSGDMRGTPPSPWSLLASRFCADRTAEHDLHAAIGGLRLVPPAEGALSAYPFAVDNDYGVPELWASVAPQQLDPDGRWFAAANRLRWLAWAAGLLLGADASSEPAEACWWRYVFASYLPVIETDPVLKYRLAGVASRSAVLAAALADAGCRQPRPENSDAWGAFLAAGRPPVTPDGERWSAFRSTAKRAIEKCRARAWEDDHVVLDLCGVPTAEARLKWAEGHNRRPPDADRWVVSGRVRGAPPSVKALIGLVSSLAGRIPVQVQYGHTMFPSAHIPLFNRSHDGIEAVYEIMYLFGYEGFVHLRDVPLSGCRGALSRWSPFVILADALESLTALSESDAVREFQLRAVRYNPWLDADDKDAAEAAVRATLGHSAGGVSQLPSNPPPLPPPNYCAATRTLRIGPWQFRYPGTAKNQTLVMETFHTAGWPPRIANPLPRANPNDTVRDIKKSRAERTDSLHDGRDWEGDSVGTLLT